MLELFRRLEKGNSTEKFVQLYKICKDKKTVVMCHHGMRSMNTIQYLKTKGFNKLINLDGGIHAWAVEIDSEMETY